jgi:hypothetical protein
MEGEKNGQNKEGIKDGKNERRKNVRKHNARKKGS